MLSTALAVVKALQVPPKPLTVNGVTYDGSEAVDVTVGEVPIVASVEEMTDRAKAYALEETGTLWRYRLDGQYEDVLKTAEKQADDGYPYNVAPDGTLLREGGVGWRNHARVNSAGEESDDGSLVDLTGFIPVCLGQTVYLKGFTLSLYEAGYQSNNLMAYGADKSFIAAAIYTPTQWCPTPDENGVYAFTLSESMGTVSIAGAAYIRVQARAIREGAVVSLDRYPEGEELGYRWVDTGIPAGDSDQAALQRLESRTAALETESVRSKARLNTLERAEDTALPLWWREYLPARIRAIRSHQDEGGRDAFSFAIISDIHESANLGRRTGAVARAVMDACGMTYAVELGDAATRSSVSTRAEMEASLEEAAAILAPIGEGLLRTQGNHDGAWGNEGGAYVHTYSDRELYNRIFRHVAPRHEPAFDEGGVGYFVDDPRARARFVVLNTHHTGEGHSYFTNHRLGQSQFDLLVKALTTMPGEDWCALLFSHVPPVWGADFDEDGVEEVHMEDTFPEQILLRNLIRAFQERHPAFSGSYAAGDAWDAVRLTQIDFSAAKGAVVACFGGHLHGDAVYGVEQGYPVPVIAVRCDAAAEKYASQKAEIREAGTCTEHSFDAVTVVRSTSGFTVYLDKIGAGSDRVVRVAV